MRIIKRLRVHETEQSSSQVVGHVNQADLRETLMELLSDPEMSRALHNYDDLDNADNAHHHTLGQQPHQAKSGF